MENTDKSKGSEKQIIVCLSREFASGGRIIARKISEDLGIHLYDESIIEEIAKEKGIDPATLSTFDEVPKSIFGSRTVRGFTTSPHVNVAKLQFDFLLEKAKKGESFLALGRCAESVLSDFDNLIAIFIMADADAKVARVMEFENCDEDEAVEIIRINNKKRKDYHNYYSTKKFGDSRYYDICINTSLLGIEETAEFLVKYIKRRIQKI